MDSLYYGGSVVRETRSTESSRLNLSFKAISRRELRTRDLL